MYLLFFLFLPSPLPPVEQSSLVDVSAAAILFRPVLETRRRGAGEAATQKDAALQDGRQSRAAAPVANDQQLHVVATYAEVLHRPATVFQQSPDLVVRSTQYGDRQEHIPQSTLANAPLATGHPRSRGARGEDVPREHRRTAGATVEAFSVTVTEAIEAVHASQRSHPRILDEQRYRRR